MPGARIVLLVGGSSGVGLASALAFAARGDRLVLVSRSAKALAAAAAACRQAGAGSVETVPADVTVGAEVEAVVHRTVELHGRVDVAVFSAVAMAYGAVEAIPAEVFERVVATAVYGTANLARALLPTLRRQRRGTLIVVNSVLGSITVPRLGGYAVAKWGQRALVHTLQQELRNDPGVRVCLVSPGSVNTPIYYQAANYLGRAVRPPWPVTSPERVAAVVVSLAERPRRHVSVAVGAANPLVVAGFRLLPRLYDRLIAATFRVASVTRRQVQPTSGNVLSPVPENERVRGHWPPPRG